MTEILLKVSLNTINQPKPIVPVNLTSMQCISIRKIQVIDVDDRTDLTRQDCSR
jgi:hypothetical protein